VKRARFLAAAIAALGLSAVPGPATGQFWHTEVGFRGGFARLQKAGAGGPGRIDLIDLPGGDYLGQVQSQSALFLVVPVSGPLAIEPSLSFQQNTPTLIVGTMFLAGLRADVALPSGFYAAVGGALRYRDATQSAMQPGVQVAAGWRVQVLGPVSARVEAQANAFKKTAQTFAYDAYAIEIGVSTRLDTPRPPLLLDLRSRPRPRGIWEPMIGFSGGYSRLHLIGGGDLSVLSFPGTGTGSLSGIFAPGTAPFFFVVPALGRLALEVGLDAHRAQSPGPNTVFSGQVSPRLDLALSSHWYVAAGVRSHLLSGSGKPLVAVGGIGVGAGYRWDVTPDVAARTELSYSMDRGRKDFGVTPANSLGLSIGLMVAPLR